MTDTTPATTESPARRSTVSKAGNAKCPTCKTSLPVTKFPTTRNAEREYVRDTSECRSCRDARREAKKATKTAAA